MQKKYYGAQTERALKNFPFSSSAVSEEFIFAIANIKQAAAVAHRP